MVQSSLILLNWWILPFGLCLQAVQQACFANYNDVCDDESEMDDKN